jgi:predicted HTH domain antitoxin
VGVRIRGRVASLLEAGAGFHVLLLSSEGTGKSYRNEVPSMTKLVLEIPEDVQSALRLPPGEAEREMLKELAVALYERQALSFGKARALAQMTHLEFDELLGERNVIRHYSADDLEEDIEYARSR